MNTLSAARQAGRRTLPCATKPRTTRSPARCVPRGSTGTLQDTDPPFIGSHPGSLAAHTAQTSEENQGIFGNSEYLAFAQLRCKDVAYQGTKTLGSLMKHIVFFFSFLSSYFLKMNPLKTTYPVVPNLQAFTDAKSFMQNSLGVIRV